MSDWIKRFADDCKSQHLSEETIDKYVSHLEFIRDELKCDLEKCHKDTLLKAYDHFSKKQPAYHRYIGILIRQALRFLGRDELVQYVKLPKMSVIKKDRESKIKEKIIPPEDVKKLIEKAPNQQDRLLIYMLYETGGRAGEIYNIKIKDVQWDDYSALVWLRGKSGTRRARIFECAPDLRDQINNHSEKDNPDSRLFHYGIKDSSNFHIRTFNNVVRRLGERILGRPIHPHQFRHTRATINSSLFTDREMMILFGWKRSDMIEIYSHLSQRDVDHKVLVMHGKKSKDEIMQTLTEKRTCDSCKEENAPFAVYCHKCGQVLGTPGLEQTQKEMHELKEDVSILSQLYLTLDSLTSGIHSQAKGVDHMDWLEQNPIYQKLKQDDPTRAKDFRDGWKKFNEDAMKGKWASLPMVKKSKKKK